MGLVLQMLTISVDKSNLLLCKWKTLVSLGRAGFQTPLLTIFGKVGKIGCQSAFYLGESFRLEGTANVISIDKPAAACDR